MLNTLRFITSPFTGMGIVFWMFIGIPFKDGKYIAYRIVTSSVVKEAEKQDDNKEDK